MVLPARIELATSPLPKVGGQYPSNSIFSSYLKALIAKRERDELLP